MLFRSLDKNMMLAADNSGCGATIQNSYQKLLQNVGPANSGPDVMPPTIDFVVPHSGDTVASGFAVSFGVSDDHGVASVDLWLDGQNIGSTIEPWTFQILGGAVSAGNHTLKGTAHDLAGNSANSQQITVTVLALGQSPGDLGSACTQNTDCHGPTSQCAFDEGANRHFCTRTCTAAQPCPDNFDCVDAGGPKVCVASAMNGSHGGCSVGPSGRPGAHSSLAGALLLGLGLAALVLARGR